MKITDRKYVAVSIKHSIAQNSPTPVLWKFKRTKDDERCFASYTTDINKCELYSLKDFQEIYGNGHIKCDRPVTMYANYKKRYKKYGTVLVDFDELKQFLRRQIERIEREKQNKELPRKSK